MKQKSILPGLPALLLLLLLSISCIREIGLQNLNSVSSGESNIEAEISFRPMKNALDGQTKSGGQAIREIRDLNILFYSIDLKGQPAFYRCEYITAFTTDPDVPRTGNNADFAEDRTPRATFSLKVPNGRYRIYAVANMGQDLSRQQDRISTEDGLKSIVVPWNPSDVTANAQMSGYFSTSTAIPQDGPHLEAEDIVVKGDMKLYAWLRRLASKVTIAFDGRKLDENIFLYIHSAQLKDIPASCPLGKENKPSGAADLIPEGGKIVYADWNTVHDENFPARVTKGKPFYPEAGQRHQETSEALYFFENMQGKGKDKRQDADGDHQLDAPAGSAQIDKDGKPYGTYVEVEAYYINRTAANPSTGRITYRFMLGKDILTDYDAGRNCHFKLTLRFNKEANDADWHIDYVPEVPEIEIENPLYISYLQDEMLEVPFRINGAPDGTAVKVEITANPWTSLNSLNPHKHTNQEPANGFLLLKAPQNKPDRFEEWTNGRQTTVTIKGEKSKISLWTRGLILGDSFSGANIDFFNTRNATVRLTVNIKGQTYTKDVTVKQVRRLENPTGIWRHGHSTRPFVVDLTYCVNDTPAGSSPLEQLDAYHYESLVSNGPWTASIVNGADWAEISPMDTDSWGPEVKGTTGSKIQFVYRPKSQLNPSWKLYRSGLIKITYHNDMAVHYIYISQGHGRQKVGQTLWHTSNYDRMEGQTRKDTGNPLLEGCMYKYGNYMTGLLPENNSLQDFGKDHSRTPLQTTDGPRLMQDIPINRNGFILETTSPINVATTAEWLELDRSSEKRYGIMYGDESTGVQYTAAGATQYRHSGEEKGMRGLFCELGQGESLFFPMSSTGYGHRKFDEGNKHGVLRYAQRAGEMPPDLGSKLPNYYDLYRRRGAIYWTRQDRDNAAWDINYYTFLTNTYGSNPLVFLNGNLINSDACFIRYTGGVLK